MSLLADSTTCTTNFSVDDVDNNSASLAPKDTDSSFDVTEFNRAPTLDDIQRVQAAMLQSDLIVDTPVEHYFAPGMYGRKLTIKAGTLVVGKIHKTTHLAVLAKGELTVTAPGVAPRRMSAGEVVVTLPGTKRAVYAHEDSVFVCFHATNETDPERLEDQLIEKEENLLCHGQW